MYTSDSDRKIVYWDIKKEEKDECIKKLLRFRCIKRKNISASVLKGSKDMITLRIRTKSLGEASRLMRLSHGQ